MVNVRRALYASSVFVVGVMCGCSHSEPELHYLGDADLKHYKHEALSIDYVNRCEVVPEEITAAEEPRTISNRSKDEIWNMSLEQALEIARQNNRVIRTSGSIVANPQGVSTVYDQAIQESGVLFGGRSVEAALSDFDTTFSTQMLWGRAEQVQNNAFTGSGSMPGSTLQADTGMFRSSLQKQFGYGAGFTVGHDWDYQGLNVPGQLFPSVYTGHVRAEYRQPLWAGAGTEFTRVAGPLNPNFSGITGVSQGVVIARINSDISLTQFEQSVRQMHLDVENAYWGLYLTYQVYRTAVVARNSALKTWRDAEATDRAGGIDGFDKSDVPQAADNYYQRKSIAEALLNAIYAQETELRRLLGLSVNDGRIIRPSDDPTKAQFIPDWRSSLTEMLSQRLELRRQKWSIKSLELQLEAAKSLTRPQFDFVSSYRVNGFGDHLLGQNDNDGITSQGLSSAYETINQGDQTTWNLGFVASMPLGFRSARAQVRNYELRLTRELAILAAQELELAQSLAAAFQELSVTYANAQSNLNRQRAAALRVDILDKQRIGGVLKADLVLRAQASLADAEKEYYTSLTDYNKAIANLHFTKGSLLEYYNVYLAEGPWTAQANEQALRRAWARSHAFDNPMLKTEPVEFALPGRGPEIDWESPNADNSADYSPAPYEEPETEEAPPAVHDVAPPKAPPVEPAGEPSAILPVGATRPAPRAVPEWESPDSETVRRVLSVVPIPDRAIAY